MEIQKKKLTVSIVLYKHSFDTIRQLFENLLSSKIIQRIYIIDNSPVDIMSMKFNQPHVEYISVPSNPGYGVAHNIAIKKSIDSCAEYHLVVNPDILFKPYILEILLEYLDVNSSIGNLMPRVLYPNGSIQYLCKLLPTPYDWIGRRFNPFKKLVEKRNEKFELRFTGYDKIMDVPYLSGCFMLLRIQALRQTGLFDENIFMYGEETDLCRRLIKNGYRTVFYPEVDIYHEFQKGSHKSGRLTRIGIQSAIYYFNKWGWFFDSERNEINKNALNALGYNE